MRVFFFAFLFSSFFATKADQYQVFSENGKMGIKNDQGTVIVPASFEALGWSDGSFSVIGNVTGYRKDKLWGILNLKKEFVTHAEFESLIHSGADNIVATKKINPAYTKAGCLNLQGEIKIPFKYDGISIHGLRAIVFTIEKGKYHYGLIDLENHIIIPIQYQNIYPLGTLRYAVQNEYEKIALFSESGKPVTDFQIDSISQFFSDKAIIYQNLKQGIINRDGQIIQEPKFRSIKIKGEQINVQLPNEWYFINKNNEIVKQIDADELTPLPNNIYRINRSGKYGLSDENLNLICPIQYQKIECLENGLFLARLKNKEGIITESNTVIIPFIYDSIKYDESLCRVYKRIEGWSIIDLSNQIISEKYYDGIEVLNNKLYAVTNNHYWGIVTSDGKETIHCVYDSIITASSKLFVVKYRNQYGIINHREDWKIAPQPLPIHLVNDSIFYQKQLNNVLIKNLKGELIYFTENQLKFESNYMLEHLPDGTEKTIDYGGLSLNRTPPSIIQDLERVFDLSEGMRGFKKDGKYGFMDTRGRLRIANRYDDIGEFHEGLAAFKLIGKWGFINTSDEIAIHPNYEQVSIFRDGLAIACRSGLCGVIDNKGKSILNFQYDSIQYLSNKKFRLASKNKFGLADETGKILIDPRFHQLEEIENDLVIVGIDKKYGVITNTGLSLIPIIYDKLTYDKKKSEFLALKISEEKRIEVK